MGHKWSETQRRQPCILAHELEQQLESNHEFQENESIDEIAKAMMLTNPRCSALGCWVPLAPLASVYPHHTVAVRLIMNGFEPDSSWRHFAWKMPESHLILIHYLSDVWEL